MLFMADEALRKFQNSLSWTVGVDGTVALAKIGANGAVETYTIPQPAIGGALGRVISTFLVGITVQSEHRLDRPHW